MITKVKKLKEYSNHTGRVFIRIECISDGKAFIGDIPCRADREALYFLSYSEIKQLLLADNTEYLGDACYANCGTRPKLYRHVDITQH